MRGFLKLMANSSKSAAQGDGGGGERIDWSIFVFDWSSVKEYQIIIIIIKVP